MREQSSERADMNHGEPLSAIRATATWLALFVALGAGACDGRDQEEPADAPESAPEAIESREPPPEGSEASEATRGSVPPATSFRVRLDTELGMQSAEGDTFTVTLAEPLRAEGTDEGADGAVIVPSGAAVGGAVTAVQQMEGENHPGVLKIDFRQVDRNGEPIPLYVVVVETNPEPVMQGGGGAPPDTAAAALLGRVVAAGDSQLVRETFAAASGTGIVLEVPGARAILPAGSEIVLRLDAALEVEPSER